MIALARANAGILGGFGDVKTVPMDNGSYRYIMYNNFSTFEKCHKC